MLAKTLLMCVKSNHLMRVPAPCAEEPDITEGRPSTLRLRLLATSDLHMRLLDYDYLQDHPAESGSLAKLASLIEEARGGADVCVLLDNGDTLQGTPVADYLARKDAGQPHPMAMAFNTLQYDAVGLGNHDTDLGLDRLAQTLGQYRAPVVCSNLETDALPMVQRGVLLTRRIAGPGGGEDSVRIGVVSALPQMTGTWNRHHLADRATLRPVLPAIAAAAQALRDKGADMVIALAHMGITLGDEGDAPQNLAIDVARLPEVDAVVGGHTHMRVPGTDHEGTPGVDAARGLIGGTPVVQPGYAGSDLGQIDFELAATGSGWRVVSCRAALRTALPGTPESPAIVALCEAAHQATRAYLSEEVAQISAPMHTYFALARPCPVSALLAGAKMRSVGASVADSDLAGLPLLAAVSAVSTGGFEGPENFVALEGGRLCRSHLAGLNPYANQVWAVRTSGARIRDWLERSALIFNMLVPDQPDQPLLNAKVPGFRFDTIHGLEYTIDPTRPPAFDAAGRRLPGAAGRITDLRYQDRPVAAEDEFLVATTDHRAGGGGAHLPFADDEIVVRGCAPLETALLQYLEAPDWAAVQTSRPWQFRPNLGIAAVLHTAPAALHHLDEIGEFRPKACDMTTDGFLGIRLHL